MGPLASPAEQEMLRLQREAQLQQAELRARRRDGVELPAGWPRKLLSKLLRRRP